MYCVKVDEGRERARVRDYHSGFLPSYKPAYLFSPDFPARPNVRGAKHLVVPGYIFMLRRAPRSQPVDEEEWKIIEAISDSHPSVLDPETGKIVDGPLKDLNHLVTRVEGDHVRITVTLLGLERRYWIQVALPAPASEGPEEAAEGGAGESAEKKAEAPEGKPEEKNEGTPEEKEKTDREEPNMSQKPDYTPEQQAAMLARAEEIGIHAAAKEYGIPWQTLTHMKRRVEKEAGQVPARAEKPKKAAAGKEKGKEKEKPDVSVETEEAGDDLKVENAILKEKIAKLETKVKKLQKALAELIAD